MKNPKQEANSLRSRADPLQPRPSPNQAVLPRQDGWDGMGGVQELDGGGGGQGAGAEGLCQCIHVHIWAYGSKLGRKWLLKWARHTLE